MIAIYKLPEAKITYIKVKSQKFPGDTMIHFGQLINQRKFIFTLGLAAVGLLITPNSAKAFSLIDTTGFNDTSFQQLLDNGQFKELFVTEGRIGNDNLTGERELGINNNVQQGGLPVADGQYAWANNQPVDFTLAYTGKQVNFTVGGTTLTSTSFTGDSNTIFLRTFASNNSTLALSNLSLNGQAIGKNLYSSGFGSNQDAEYIQIDNTSTPFVLSGKSIMNWTGATPARSQLAYQIKVGNLSIAKIPEPSYVPGILLLGVLALGSRRIKEGVRS